MDKLYAAQIFVAVVEYGSFSAAARTLNMTPSNVSRQIKKLEFELGAQLFHRTTRNISLTEAGELFYHSTARAITEIDHARVAVSNLANAPSGDLHLTAPMDLANALIAPHMSEFLDKYPDIRIRVTMASEVLDLVEERIDLAIRMRHMEDSSLIARKLLSSRSLLYASPSYIARHGEPETPDALKDHHCLSFQIGPGQKPWEFEVGDDTVCMPIKGPVHTNSLSFLKSIAMTGTGIVMLPNWMLSEEVEKGTIVQILKDYKMTPSQTPINIVYPQNRILPPKVRVFIDFLTSKFSGH